MSNSGLAGRVALITGAGRGFGRAIAEKLAAEGVAVAISGRTGPELDAVVAAIQARGGRAVAAVGDVRDTGAIEAMAGTAEQALGPVDFLVSNAGLPGPFGPLHALDSDKWWQAMEVHLRAPMLLARRLLPGMRARGSGRIINIVSLAARRIEPGLSAYCVGKAAAVRLTEHIAAENRDSGVSAFALHPGDAVTSMAHQTISDPDARRFQPHMVEGLKDWIETVDSDTALMRCAEVTAALLGGRHDALSGRYLEPGWDLDALAGQPAEPVFLHG